MTMIERVARAIARGEYGDYVDDVWQTFIDDAIAVLEEMRKPTEFMLVAGARNRTAIGRFYTGDDTLEPEWAAMIDAALEEAP